jgi:plastocyanin
MRRTSLRAAGLCVALVAALALAGCGGTSPYGSTTGGSSTPAATSTGGSGTSGGGYGYGSSGGTSATTAPDTISMQNTQFSPSSLTVKVGATVSIVNNDSYQHHVVVGTQDLGVQDPGKTVTWKAAKAGTHALKCLIHTSMTGEIVVQ